ncbi:hypothetical protein Pmani_034541 [Petrolisthes manimaculis]|uniref:Uncharacterized protein n=1 Tax=Petrolisthes manimaculis TaxID=1843537 RepID=A0AAE1TP15_9EUCA|nr:hypothetical protein Pmani_034541 [Petrolisthes manimaculis]
MPILQNEAHLTALNVEIAEQALHVEELLGEQKKMVTECFRKLGNDNELILRIKRLDLNISNQPLDTEKGLTMGGCVEKTVGEGGGGHMVVEVYSGPRHDLQYPKEQ